MPLRSNSRPILRVSPMAALAGPRAHADAPHAQPRQLGDGRTSGAGEHVQGPRYLPDEGCDGVRVLDARQAIRGKGSILERRDLGERRWQGNPAGMGGGARDGGPLGLGVRRAAGKDLSPGALSLARSSFSAGSGFRLCATCPLSLCAGCSGSDSTTSCSTPPSRWWTPVRPTCLSALTPSSSRCSPASCCERASPFHPSPGAPWLSRVSWL